MAYNMGVTNFSRSWLPKLPLNYYWIVALRSTQHLVSNQYVWAQSSKGNCVKP
jgi:hypothetical protein